MFHKQNVSWALVAVAALGLLGAPTLSGGTNTADEEGFVSLFDGKSLTGWNLMNGAKFVVEDGVIKHTDGHGWLRSDKQYADYQLHVEFRFLKPKQDSGVFLRAGIEGKDWPDQKYEVQMENTKRMAMIFAPKNDLNVDLVQKTLKPDGEWNTYDIKIVEPRIEFRLNGVLVSTTDSADALKKGFLGIQAEDGSHEYRTIKIKELTK